MRRWTIYEHLEERDHPLWTREVYEGSPNEGDDEGIEVMPVSEHEVALAELLALWSEHARMVDCAVEAMREAARQLA